MKANFETGLKVCSCCKQELPLSSFARAKNKPDGLQSYCRACNRVHAKKYEQSEKGKETNKRSNHSLKGKISHQKYEKSAKGKKVQCQATNKYFKKRRRADINFRLSTGLRSRVCQILQWSKSQTSFSLLSCSIEEFRKHIESQFQEGMTWENYGEWELDHIIPIAYFRNNNPDWKVCFHYLNYQPLWKRRNQIKKDILPENYQEIINNIKSKICF